MKIITSYPVKINGKKINNAGYYLNVGGDNEEFYNGGGKMSDDAKKGLLGLGLAGATAGIGLLASRGSQKKTGLQADVKTACGRKPLFGKAKKAAYQKCATDFANKGNQPANAVDSMPQMPPPPAGMSTGVKIGIGVGALVLVGAIIYFVRKGRANK